MLLLRRKMSSRQPPSEPSIQEGVEVVQDVAPQAVNRRLLRTTSVDSAASRAATANKAKAVIEENLKLIANAERAIDDAQAVIAQSNKIIEAHLKLANLEHHTDGVYLASIVEQWTNQLRVIDPKKFRNKVANDVFWDSISVAVGKASQHLTERELNDIADIKPSVMTGRVLKVKKLEPKRRKTSQG